MKSLKGLSILTYYNSRVWEEVGEEELEVKKTQLEGAQTSTPSVQTKSVMHTVEVGGVATSKRERKTCRQT